MFDVLRRERDYYKAEAYQHIRTIALLRAKIEGYEAAIARMASPSDPVCTIPESAFPEPWTKAAEMGWPSSPYYNWRADCQSGAAERMAHAVKSQRS